MSQRIAPEQRAKIVSSVKDEGMSIVDAAKTFSISAETVKKWLRRQTRNAHTSSTEVQRLRQENQSLKEIIGEMVLHQRKKKSPLLGTW